MIIIYDLEGFRGGEGAGGESERRGGGGDPLRSWGGRMNKVR